jgi:hypothetical protein
MSLLTYDADCFPIQTLLVFIHGHLFFLMLLIAHSPALCEALRRSINFLLTQAYFYYVNARQGLKMLPSLTWKVTSCSSVAIETEDIFTLMMLFIKKMTFAILMQNLTSLIFVCRPPRYLIRQETQE